MTAWRLGVVAGALAAVMTIGLASCGDDDDGGGGGGGGGGISRDPLTLDIQAATVPDLATTALPTVTFRVLDGAGNPIDLEAELASTTTPTLRSPGRAPSFTLAMLDDNGDYVSYYATTRSPGAYTYIADPEIIGTSATFVPPPTATRTQAGSVTVAAGPNLAAVGSRVYRFTFPAPTAPTAGLDRAKTHTVAGWLVRRPNDFDQDVAFDSFNFIPAGVGTTAVQRLETVTDQACNRCHGFVQAHGTRRGVQFCITCHSPQTGDPETDRTVDFKVMIHKIHYGSGLPSVRQGEPYFIVGFGQSVHDWSDVAFPWHDHGVQHCSVCHQGQDANNWRTRPSPKACLSCHDNVQFTADSLPSCGSLAAANKFQDCFHSGGAIPVTDVNAITNCQACHGDGAPNAVDLYHHAD